MNNENEKPANTSNPGKDTGVRNRLGSSLRELLLIVIGVLLALAVDNLNAVRKEHDQELFLLRQLQVSLREDQANISSLQQIFGLSRDKMELLKRHLEQGQPYADSLDAYFGAVIGIWPFHPNYSVYEVVKAQGLQLISNDSLRLGIARLYDQVYASYLDAQANDRNVIFEVVRPYYLQEFRSIRVRESATPMAYEELIGQSYYLNLLEYRLGTFNVTCIAPASIAMDELTSLLASLDQEIKSLD